MNKTTHAIKTLRYSTRLLCALWLLGSWCLTSCTAVKTPVRYQYTLSAFHHQATKPSAGRVSILVNPPDAVAGYGTEQMLYLTKPYELNVFAHNAWINPPADLLFPLIIQSLQASHYFFAVASTASAEATDYRLDTQLLTLQQNFLHRPSVLEFSAKVVLTRSSTSQMIASRIIRKQIPCRKNTPYAGVIAANQATQEFTAELTQFVIHAIQSHS